MNVVHKNILVKGRVQGVYFRSSAFKEARKYNLKGFVRNESDGSVYIEAEGENEGMLEFIKWCRKGSAASDVTHVDVSKGELKEFSKFEVI
ncbi:MAG TPA: acylphosphatase [Chitinophagaceae bacterium]|nr:acylphosphatase [Chitinophagaceae bacterium]